MKLLAHPAAGCPAGAPRRSASMPASPPTSTPPRRQPQRRPSRPSPIRPRATRASIRRRPIAQSCAACHSADGNSGIAGQPQAGAAAPRVPRQAAAGVQVRQAQEPDHAGRLAAQLSRRRHAQHRLRSSARKKAKTGFAKDKELVALGEKIYRGGIADRQVPACAGCHSPNGAGIPAQYPRLARPARRLHRPRSWWPSATACAQEQPADDTASRPS